MFSYCLEKKKVFGLEHPYGKNKVEGVGYLIHVIIVVTAVNNPIFGHSK